MASGTDTMPAKALPNLPDTTLRTLLNPGAALWNWYEQLSKAGSAAAVHAPPFVRSPQQQGHDAPGTSQDEICVTLHNTPRGACVSASASGAVLHIDTGRGVKSHGPSAAGSRTSAPDVHDAGPHGPASDADTVFLSGANPGAPVHTVGGAKSSGPQTAGKQTSTHRAGARDPAPSADTVLISGAHPAPPPHASAGARAGNLPATSTPNALDTAAGADAVFLSGAKPGAPAPVVVPAAPVPAKGGLKAITGEVKTISRPVTNFDIWAGKLHDLWYGDVLPPEQFSPTRDKEMLDAVSSHALQFIHDSHATGAPPTAVAVSIMEELRQRQAGLKGAEEVYGDSLIHTQPRTIPRYGPPPPPLVSDVERAERHYQEILPRAEAGLPIQAEKGEHGIKKILEQAGNPMKLDIGPGNINFGTACYNLNLYLAAHPHDDPLGLRKYKGNYPALWDDMTGPNAMTTAIKITAVHIGLVQDYYRKKDAAWYDSLSDAQKDIALESGYRASRSALDVYFDPKNKEGLKPADLVATKPHLKREDWYDMFHDPRSPYFPAVKILKAPLAEGGDKG